MEEKKSKRKPLKIPKIVIDAETVKSEVLCDYCRKIFYTTYYGGIVCDSCLKKKRKRSGK